MNVEKRRRNYNNFEVEILLACVAQRKHIIENKTTNAISNREKTTAWEAVCAEFNAVVGVQECSVEQLQNLYRNTKRKANKKSADELAPYEERMREMGVLRMSLPTPLDSDGIIENPSNNIKVECSVPGEGESGDQNLRTPGSIVPEVDLSNTTSNSSSTKLKMTTQKSSLPVRFLTRYQNKVKRHEPATAKAAGAIHQQAEARKAQIEEEVKLTKEKIRREMELNEEKFTNDMLLNKEKHEQHMQHAKERFEMEKVEHKMKMQRFLMEKEEHHLRMQLLRAQLQKKK